MKLKFRADPRDLMLFGIYAVILLYFVAIAVLNFAQFAMGDIDHPFHGFNPFPAFGKGYLGVTIVIYIIALVASLFSVSDRFFDMEKGFGFSTESKKEKGYSRWLDERELKRNSGIKMVNIKDETADAGGVPLINDGKRMWVDDSEGHNIIIGSTGAGKSQITMFPLIKSLAKHDESMIVTDPKGELYEGTSAMLKKRGYNVLILNFRDPQKGSGWNPLHLPYDYYKKGNRDKANELVDDLAINILYDANAQNQDPFWEKTSADYFSGICLGLFEDAKEDEINLNSVNAFTTVGEEKAGPNITYVNQYFKYKDPTSPAYISASSTIIAPNDTKGSILSVFKQKLRLFAARENVSEMLSHSDFEMEDIGSKKTAVFIVIQDEKKTYHPLVTIFVKQCYEALVDYAQRCGGKLPYRTNFLLDEFANMPKLTDVETMVSAARSRKMRFFFVIQNFAQLAEVYGKNKADTIRGNCTNTIYLISTELAALEEISKMCGEIKVKTGKGDKEKEETRPLITVSDLQKLKQGEIILLRSRLDPFRTKLKMDWEIDWGPLYKTDKSSASYPDRKKEEVHIFDLKTFVNNKKQEKINELINGGGTSLNQSVPTPKSTFSAPASKKPNAGLNIDSLLKKIDTKIAELEAEEEKAKLDAVTTDKTPNLNVLDNVVSDKPFADSKNKDVVINNEVNRPKVSPLKPKMDQKKGVDTKALESSLQKPVLDTGTSIEKVKPNLGVKPDLMAKPASLGVDKLPHKNDVHESVKPVIKHNIQTPSSVARMKNKKEFADKIANRVNEIMKNKHVESSKNVSSLPNKKVNQISDDYVSDDQFFDDFFADDDDF